MASALILYSIVPMALLCASLLALALLSSRPGREAAPAERREQRHKAYAPSHA